MKRGKPPLSSHYVELAQSSIMEDIGGADPPDGNQENQYPWVSERTVPGAYDVLNNPPLNLPVASGNCVRNQDTNSCTIVCSTFGAILQYTCQQPLSGADNSSGK
jgi:hypothetical protein